MIKAFERLNKIERGKSTHRICEMNKHHQAALSLLEKTTEVIAVEERWMVQCESKDGMYSVTRRLESCSCKMSCSTCNICVHMYRYSCMDWSIHCTICKHIHLVYMCAMQRNEGDDQKSCYILQCVCYSDSF